MDPLSQESSFGYFWNSPRILQHGLPQVQADLEEFWGIFLIATVFMMLRKLKNHFPNTKEQT